MDPVDQDDSARRKRDIRPEYSVSPDDDLYGSPRSWAGAQWTQGRRGAISQDEDEPFILRTLSPHTDHPQSAAFVQDRELYRRTAESPRKRRGSGEPYGVARERPVSAWTLQILASAFLLGAVALMFHSDQPLALQIRHGMRQVFATDYLRTAPSAFKTALGAGVSAGATISVTAQPLDVIAPISGPITRAFSVISPDIVLHGRPGSTVAAAADGLVVAAGESQANGSYVLIDHGAFGQTFYAHLGKVVVHAQEYVTAGETIGYLPNNSGNLTFGYIRAGSYRDPASILGRAK
ncbi:MAG: peptidoglycan DD-metalloendopeptidase family protein [Bacilli bacterium]